MYFYFPCCKVLTWCWFKFDLHCMWFSDTIQKIVYLPKLFSVSLLGTVKIRKGDLNQDGVGRTCRGSSQYLSSGQVIPTGKHMLCISNNKRFYISPPQWEEGQFSPPAKEKVSQPSQWKTTTLWTPTLLQWTTLPNFLLSL